ncbi:DUF6925 family protein [Pseudaminobacter soli (ex Li et al. 2025)]|uniref:Uncharacterized protein n=1 Tax=Pseudaminobacter soli (ex Li et al. 2025) TaxID=1295366 RepID=A0A2P7S4F0_9HYPH|nr:hypothetical protein [Mesorhizobium soli]PSJ57311.1 hypothetical protein C7I85_22185 [Mesorhizobium soli]
MITLHDLIRDHLRLWQSGWSMGTFGAIAEFHQDRDEMPVIDDGYTLSRATRRGAVHIDRKRVDQIVPVAYETLSPRPNRWSQAVALCMPDALARRAARPVLTELGPDDDAVRGIDRTGILFDMGLSLPQCDFCIRTSDPKLLAVLRANLGRSLFEPGNDTMHAILAAHPHRVALTNIGRVEVFQKIGGPDTGGVSPAGPHTHVLPKLLKTGRTHSANTPIPAGLMPLASLHPGNPVIGPMGEDTDFDPALHRQFQDLLAAYGQPEFVRLKTAVLAALRHSEKPESFVVPDGRFERGVVRLALRQQARLADLLHDVEFMRQVADWRRVHDQRFEGEDEDDDSPGH